MKADELMRQTLAAIDASQLAIGAFTQRLDDLAALLQAAGSLEGALNVQCSRP